VLESQAQSGYWHSLDDGAVAAQAYVHPIMRDGTPHVDLVLDEIGHGDSPQTTRLKITGVGAPEDKGLSRRASRIQRWYDRYIDMHRYPVVQRPLAETYSRPQRGQVAVPDGNQYDSPYNTYPSQLGLGTNDRFVGQLVRRAPGAWDEPVSSDGTASTIAGANAGYGLTNWGL
jgi:hypothetical protein